MSEPLVLVVDDDEQIVSGVKLRLNAVGYRAETASNGSEGIEKAKALQPNAILMDVRMPVLDGLQALKKLKDDDETADIPVIMLSASLSDQRTAIDGGAKFFLTKPYQSSRLQAALDAIL